MVSIFERDFLKFTYLFSETETGDMISLWFFNNILSCGHTKLQKCTTLNYCQKVVENLLFINKECEYNIVKY